MTVDSQDPPRTVVRALLDFGRTVPGGTLMVALSEEAARLVLEEPFAFVLGASLDRGIPAEVAWTFPFWIRERLGHLDPARISTMSLEELDALLQSCPRRPRYRRDAPRTVRDAAQLVVREGQGDARALWRGRRAQDVHRTFRRIHGVGEGIASMVVVLLHRVFGVEFDDLDRRNMDVKADVHVVRVLTRLGVLGRDPPTAGGGGVPECRRRGTTNDGAVAEAIRVTRAMNPEYPGALDTPLWVIGRTWCSAFGPRCGECPVTDVCAKVV